MSIIILLIIVIIAIGYYVWHKRNSCEACRPLRDYEGKYIKIFSKLYPDKLIHVSGSGETIGSNIVLSNDIGDDNQKWLVVHDFANNYKFYNKASVTQLLTINSNTSGSNVVLRDDAKTNYQTWRITKTDEGYKFEINDSSFMTVGDNIKINKAIDTADQKWSISLDIQ